MRLAPWAAIVLTISLCSCAGDHQSHDSSESSGADPSSEATGSHGSHNEGEVHDADLDISLNAGSRWAMDDHTRSMFQAMTARLESGGQPGELGKGLQADLEKLIQGCTMTGEAHDQLHVFLMAYMPAVRELAESGATGSVDRVEGLLNEYPKYFE